MPLIVRTLMLWLLALALPVQGLAAATMLNCGPSHHARAAAAAPAHDHAAHDHAAHDHAAHGHAAHGHAGHQGHGAMPGGAHSHHQPATPGAAVDASDGAASNYLSDSALVKAKCSACESCCSAVALPASITQISVVQHHASPFPPLSLGIEPFVTDSPERPPRSFLA